MTQIHTDLSVPVLHNKDTKVVFQSSWQTKLRIIWLWKVVLLTITLYFLMCCFSIYRYGESTSPLLWNKLASECHSSVKCPPPSGDGPPFHIEVNSMYIIVDSVASVVRLLCWREFPLKMVNNRSKHGLWKMWLCVIFLKRFCPVTYYMQLNMFTYNHLCCLTNMGKKY